MAIYKEYTYPAATTNLLGLNQSITTNIPLVFNSGIYGTTDTKINFIDFGFIPKITLTSAGNISGITFVIKGINNGVYIEEQLVGPNIGTIQSVNYFDRIFSITPLQTSVSSVSIGVYSLGFLPLIRLNTLKQNVTNLNYSLHLSVPIGTLGITIYKSIKDCYNQGLYTNLTNNGNLVMILNQANFAGSSKFDYIDIAENILIEINPNIGNRSLIARFMQL